MSLLQVSDLTFCYEGSFDNIFENVSFRVDTDWKLGFTGRNGCGKSSFIKALLACANHMDAPFTDKARINDSHPGASDAKKSGFITEGLLSVAGNTVISYISQDTSFLKGPLKDEPLNYIDVFSRMQIEKLIENCHPTMILVEHDEAFRKKLASRAINLT